ncbi:hypothetical protein GGF49_005659 [Coemansia sp. RSA 1853]|nr:hypothetical protein LPJ76_000596 [Coemansia sp. RSA 638]KAJ2538825.1 hypothetical protein GGF49_005659 [Coemansia sp. RSA 1853]
MIRLLYFIILAGVCLAGLSEDVIRSVISGVKGGILVKDGKRTSCDLGVVTSSGAYVAKDCLDYTKAGNIDNSTTYEAYLDDGLDGKPIKYTITNFFKVTNNSETLSNNYVYLRYNNNNSTLWKNMVSPTLGYDWDAVVYVRRSLRDMDQMVWDDPEFAGLGTDYDGDCISMSGLFKEYPSYFLCKSDTVSTPTDDLTPCQLPYGTVYGIVQRKAHLMGIYSHTAISANGNMCNNTSSRSYYTALHRHMNYLQTKLNWTVDHDPSVFGGSLKKYPKDYNMKEKDYKPTQSDVHVVRGDFFKNQSAEIAYPPPEASSSDEAEGDDESSNRNSIIIGVCVGVGGAFIIIGIGLFVWWWRERHSGSVDPMSRNEYQNMLESDLGGLSVPRDGFGAAERDIIADYDLPPVYDDPVEEQGPKQSTEQSTTEQTGVSTTNSATQSTREKQ